VYVALVGRDSHMWDRMTYKGVCSLGRMRNVYVALDDRDRRSWNQTI
jgi:hypothetical protein